MSSLDPIISADLVRTRAELAAVTTALANARNEIAGVANVMNATRSELAAARNEIAGVGASSIIKSVQRGVLELPPYAGGNIDYLDIAVSAVNPARAVVNFGGFNGVHAPSGVHAANPIMVTLFSATSIRARWTLNMTGMFGMRVSWELVEYK
ncbi:hypothetical protein CHL79_16025 [Delftia acidovorans]|uniref:hypothetical protein n=1 Tax=Delftia acidovorans TaxID=80866 RepID=UPI000BC34C1F|nr:hypothetical protein [Delftia acidovorans]ATH13824.1 hypothetical protein CHL79_16025 [Delftia acidovorans]